MSFEQFGRHTARVTRGAVRAGAPALLWALRRLTRSRALPEFGPLPEGRVVDLPGRGSTYVVDAPGPGPDAPVVLLLHGIGTTGSLTWFTAIAALNRRFRVVTFDQRWHGRGIPSAEFTLDDCADDAAAVLTALGVDTAVVAGYSMGGATAQVLWHRHRERVAGLVLCSTAARWRGNRGEQLFYPLLRLGSRGLLTAASARVQERAAALPLVTPADPAELRAWCLAELRSTSPWALPFVLSELGRFDSTAWIGEVSVPTAVVITANDRMIPTLRQRQLAALIPHAWVRETPGGHAALVFDTRRWLPVFLEAVDVVVKQADAAA